jgi:hypothetical protein
MHDNNNNDIQQTKVLVILYVVNDYAVTNSVCIACFTIHSTFSVRSCYFDEKYSIYLNHQVVF